MVRAMFMLRKSLVNYTITQEDVGSRFALVAFRTGVNIQDPEDVAQAQALQTKLSVKQEPDGRICATQPMES